MNNGQSLQILMMWYHWWNRGNGVPADSFCRLSASVLLYFLFAFTLYLGEYIVSRGVFLGQIRRKYCYCKQFVSMRRLLAAEQKRVPKPGDEDIID